MLYNVIKKSEDIHNIREIKLLNIKTISIFTINSFDWQKFGFFYTTNCDQVYNQIKSKIINK